MAKRESALAELRRAYSLLSQVYSAGALDSVARGLVLRAMDYALKACASLLVSSFEK